MGTPHNYVHKDAFNQVQDKLVRTERMRDILEDAITNAAIYAGIAAPGARLSGPACLHVLDRLAAKAKGE
jgi:hypothetical protein